MASPGDHLSAPCRDHSRPYRLSGSSPGDRPLFIGLAASKRCHSDSLEDEDCESSPKTVVPRHKKSLTEPSILDVVDIGSGSERFAASVANSPKTVVPRLKKPLTEPSMFDAVDVGGSERFPTAVVPSDETRPSKKTSSVKESDCEKSQRYAITKGGSVLCKHHKRKCVPCGHYNERLGTSKGGKHKAVLEDGVERFQTRYRASPRQKEEEDPFVVIPPCPLPARIWVAYKNYIDNIGGASGGTVYDNLGHGHEDDAVSWK